jgi:hypothetical protein
MALEIKDQSQFEFLWKTGKLQSGEKVKLEDALSVPNAPMLMPKVISNIVKEAAEPLLVGTSLLQRINYSYGQSISFPSVGALQAADIAEGQEYPERSLQMGGATVTANIGKVGLAVKVTEEMIRYSQFDVIGMHLRAAGRALARHKEVKIFNHIRSLGVPVFDNVTPTSSTNGVTTGRNIVGAGNGSVTMDDLFDCYAQIITAGFFPDTLLLHPLTWTMFVKDPVLRAFVLANGGGSYFASWSGNPAGRAPWDNSSQGGLGISGGQNILPGQTSTGGTAPHGEEASSLLSYPQTINSAPNLPGYFNVPFRVIVSPFVPYDPRRKLTDIYMFDSRELGVLIVDEDVMTEEFNDPKVDIRKIKLRERYAIGILNEGKAIATMKNVHVVPNEIVFPAQATIASTSTFAAITPTTVVL